MRTYGLIFLVIIVSSLAGSMALGNVYATHTLGVYQPDLPQSVNPPPGLSWKSTAMLPISDVVACTSLSQEYTLVSNGGYWVYADFCLGGLWVRSWAPELTFDEAGPYLPATMQGDYAQPFSAVLSSRRVNADGTIAYTVNVYPRTGFYYLSGSHDYYCTVFDDDWNLLYEDIVYSGGDPSSAPAFDVTIPSPSTRNWNIVFTTMQNGYVSGTSGTRPDYARTSFSGGGSLEPALGDTVDIDWTSEGQTLEAVVLRDPTNAWPAWIVAVLPTDYGTATLVDGLYHGKVTWSGCYQDNDTWPYACSSTYPYEPLYEASETGRAPCHILDVSAGFKDMYEQDASLQVIVKPTLYNVYSSDSSPLYAGEEGASGRTSVHFSIDGWPINRLNISIGEHSVDVYPWTCWDPESGDYVYTWDGKGASDDYVSSGIYPIAISSINVYGNTPFGDPLQITGLPQDMTFVRGSTDPLSIPFTIGEPVPRAQATTAFVTALVYDEAGNVVKVLADNAATLPSGQPVKINNQVDNLDGSNELAWNGTNDNDEEVDPGTYTVTVFVRDNSNEAEGIGCESRCATTTVNVVDAPPSEISLDWPTDQDGNNENGGGGAGSAITGYTDSGQPVNYSFDGETWQSVTPDPNTGLFSISADLTPGPHTVILRTSNSTFPEKTVSSSYLVNTFAITSPAQDSRLDPQISGSIPIQFTSDYVDIVNVYVQNNYDQDSCISSQNPRPAAELLNGDVRTMTVRHITAIGSPMSVVAESNSISWDGKDDSGLFVPPGLYSIVIERANTDGLLDISTETQVIIEHPAGAPSVTTFEGNTYGVSAAVRWSTDVPSNGCVMYGTGNNPVGKVFASDGGGTNHIVYLPRTMPNTTYDYYILASNPATGGTAISSRQTLTTGDGNPAGLVFSDVQSSTEALIRCISESPVAARLEYAKVELAPLALQWQRIPLTDPECDHVFSLSNLSPDAEYVYRVMSANDATWANSTATGYDWFTTKLDHCELSLTNLTDGEALNSVPDIVVRASDAQHARFSSNGITGIELYVDGNPINDYTRTFGSNYVDYAFHTSELSLSNGIHQIAVAAYDDYWQVSKVNIEVMVHTSGQLQSIGVASETPSSSGVPKKRAHALVRKDACWLVFRGARCGSIWRKTNQPIPDKNGANLAGHAFLAFNHPVTHKESWKGFAAEQIPSKLFFWKGAVRDEKRTVDETRKFTYYFYTVDDATVKELERIDKFIKQEAKDPPRYDLIPSPETSHNCATWVERVLAHTLVDKSYLGAERVWIQLPHDLECYAGLVNANR